MEQNIQQLILQEIKKLSIQVNNLEKVTNERLDKLEMLYKDTNERLDRLEELVQLTSERLKKFEKNTNERLKKLETNVSSLNRSVLLVETQYQRKIDVIYEVFPDLTEKVNANEGRSIQNKFDIESIKGAIEFNSQAKKTV